MTYTSIIPSSFRILLFYEGLSTSLRNMISILKWRIPIMDHTASLLSICFPRLSSSISYRPLIYLCPSTRYLHFLVIFIFHYRLQSTQKILNPDYIDENLINNNEEEKIDFSRRIIAPSLDDMNKMVRRLLFLLSRSILIIKITILGLNLYEFCILLTETIHNIYYSFCNLFEGFRFRKYYRAFRYKAGTCDDCCFSKHGMVRAWTSFHMTN